MRGRAAAAAPVAAPVAIRALAALAAIGAMTAMAAAPAAQGSAARDAMAAPAAGEVRVTLLGTGNPRPNLERFGPSILLETSETRLLFDAGRGSIQRLFQIGQAPLLRSVSQVFLTHLHSDHVVGLPDLWLTAWLFGRTTPLQVAGPAGTTRLTNGLQEAYGFDVSIRTTDEGLPAAGGQLRGRDVLPGVVYEAQGVRVTAFEVDHGPVKPAYGYRVDAAGRSVVFSGDTREIAALVEQARGVDLFVCEVISPEVERRRNQLADDTAVERVLARHISPEQAGRIFAEARPRLAVYSHIVPSPAGPEDLLPPTRKVYDGRVEAGYDLMTITIGDTIDVRPRPVMSDK